MTPTARTAPQRLLPLLFAALAAACGGGGGPSRASFGLSGVFPAAGTVDASAEEPIVITFNRAADLATLSGTALRMETGNGTPVAVRIDAPSFNATSVRLEPLVPLRTNELYRVHVAGTIRGEDGGELGRDMQFCFVTASDGPTVRPDQIVDLGDALREPRYLARAMRLGDGRAVVFGGYTDPGTVSDTMELYDPATRTFTLLAARMRSPRAEFTATQLSNGRILLAGGVAEPGGDPLATTEVFDPGSLSTAPGPDLLTGRRRHACSETSSGRVLVSGGLGTGDVELDTAGIWETGDSFEPVGDLLAVPTADHVQIPGGGGRVYITAGNFNGRAHFYSGTSLDDVFAPDIRFRPAWVNVDGERVMVVGGDTRSVLIFDFGRSPELGGELGGTLLFERRGAHTLSRWNDPDFLVAGGFNIARLGEPPLASMEIVRYLAPNAGDPTPDVAIWRVDRIELPVPFAGHVAIEEFGGATVLAGGVGDGVGAHSRRAVLIHDDASTPPLPCTLPEALRPAR